MMIDWENFNSGLLIEVTRSTGVYTCTGVAIKDDVILTAAHCLSGDVQKIRVFNQPSYDAQAPYWEVKNFEIHPDYDYTISHYQADIAKIKLKTKLPTTTSFYPIIKKNGPLTGKLFRIGYGERSHSNVRTLVTPLLRNVNPTGEILELEDMYSYSGDSGGPVFLQHRGQMYLVAIHSTLSHGPEGRFSYNPLLAPQKQWIERSF